MNKRLSFTADSWCLIRCGSSGVGPTAAFVTARMRRRIWRPDLAALFDRGRDVAADVDVEVAAGLPTRERHEPVDDLHAGAGRVAGGDLDLHLEGFAGVDDPRDGVVV